jgi:polar amino acid transport system permease protein
MERPFFGKQSGPTWLLLFLCTSLVVTWIDLSGTTLGRIILFDTHETDAIESTLAGRLLVGAVLGAVTVLNFWGMRFLPFWWQVAIVWCELLILFGAFFDAFGLSYSFIASHVPILIFIGAVTTIYISLLSIACASVLALAAALGRLSLSGPAYAVSTFYISFFRGTPLLLQVYLIYLGLPQLGLTLDAVPSGIIALSLCYGAYMAEIFRAGIQGVPRGQSEAAAALGLHRGLIFRKIVFPQAMRLIVPPTGNQFIAMLKDSSLVSVMGVWELMFLARTQGRSEFKHLEMLIAAAVIYWIISFVFELVQARIERHFGKGIVR